MNLQIHRSLAITAAVTVTTTLAADAVYDENIDGDLSSDAAAPTSIGVITTETLSVRGSVRTISGAGLDTRDYLSFRVPDGATLEAMRLVTYVDGTTGGLADTGYVMIDEGPSSVVPSGATSSQFLGGSYLDRSRFPDGGVNMLDRLSEGAQGGTGFPLPLGPGEYTVNVQQTGSELNAYEIRFEFAGVTPPCPGDFNGDGEVDGGDLGIFLSAWGTSPCALDLDGDGACNGADLGILLSAWGGC